MSTYGNTFANNRKVVAGGGKRVWHEIYHKYPVGGTISNLASFAVGSVIPAGSLAIWTSPSAVEIVVLPQPFDATQKYALNKEVVKDGVLYKCTTAITTPAAWDASKWTALEAGDTTYDKAAQANGLTHNDVYIEEGAFAATASVVFAGAVYSDRLGYEMPALVWENLKEVKPLPNM